MILSFTYGQYRPYIDNIKRKRDCQYMDEKSILEAQTVSQRPHEARLGFMVYRAGLAVSRGYERALAPVGITPADVGVLTSLRHGGANHVRGLARQLGLGRQTVVNVTKLLEQNLWIARRKDESDARLTLFQISPTGIQKLDDIEQTVADFDRLLAGIIDQLHEATLLDALSKIIQAPQFAYE
jgi:DNA-binding MarR family transcriptional regulator